MANNIKGNQDGLKGGNKTYTIPGRGSNIPKAILIKEVKKGKHPNHTIAIRNGIEYVRAKPNKNLNDNVNKNC